jgi:DNA-binding MarR family transcriptional regulator
MPDRASDVSTPTLVYVVGRVNQGVRRGLQARLTRWQLSISEYTVLSVLEARPDLSNAQLARRSLVTRQSMTRIIASLERRGLVTRRTDPSHGRILRAGLTPAARKLLEALAPAVRELQDEMLADVAPEHREILLAGMLSCMRRLSGEHVGPSRDGPLTARTPE